MRYKLNGKEPNTVILHGGPGAIGSASGLAKRVDNSVELYS